MKEDILEQMVDEYLQHKGTSPGTTSSFDLPAIMCVQRNKKVGFWDDLDAQRRTMNEIDDYLYDEVKDKKGVPLTTGRDGRHHRPDDAARQASDGGMSDRSGLVCYGDEVIRYEIVERPSRRTLGIEVHPGGRVLVLAPGGAMTQP